MKNLRYFKFPVLYVRGHKTTPFIARMERGRSVFRSRKPRALAWGASFIALMVYLSFPCAAQQVNEGRLKSIQGNVKSIDWVGSTLVVSFIDEKGNPREITFLVPEDLKIARGNEEIGLADVEMGDILNVEYCEVSSGPFMAKSIVNNSLANDL